MKPVLAAPLFVGLLPAVPIWVLSAPSPAVSVVSVDPPTTPKGEEKPAAAQPTPEKPKRRAPFLVNSEHHPHVLISWPTTDKTGVTLEADREYLSPNDKTPLGKNLACYVALGGNRGDYGLGRPGAVDVRVGFYKIDKKLPFFEKIAPGSAVTVVFSSLEFTAPAEAIPETMVHHLKFEDPNNVLGCAGAPELLGTWNTYNKDENMAGRLNSRNGRKGVLGEGNTSGAKVTFESDEKGRVTMTAVIPYALFKHADDPWLRSNPGDFIEPVHFHLEFEVVAKDRVEEEKPS